MSQLQSPTVIRHAVIAEGQSAQVITVGPVSYFQVYSVNLLEHATCLESSQLWLTETGAINEFNSWMANGNHILEPKKRRKIKFTFTGDIEDGVYEGETDDTHWNGFINVYVAAEVHHKLNDEWGPMDTPIEPMIDGYYYYGGGAVCCQEVQ